MFATIAHVPSTITLSTISLYRRTICLLPTAMVCTQCPTPGQRTYLTVSASLAQRPNHARANTIFRTLSPIFIHLIIALIDSHLEVDTHS
jgi:hypothetical protein